MLNSETWIVLTTPGDMNSIQGVSIAAVKTAQRIDDPQRHERMPRRGGGAGEQPQRLDAAALHSKHAFHSHAVRTEQSE